MKNELPFPHTFAQLGLQDGARRDRDLHPRIEKAQCVAAGGLGPIHRDIRPLQQVIDGLRLIAEEHATDAPGAVMFVAGEEVGGR